MIKHTNKDLCMYLKKLKKQIKKLYQFLLNTGLLED